MGENGRPLALVTGASSGIGLELARQFAGAGFDLIVAAEDDAIMTAAEPLRESGVVVRREHVDLAQRQEVERLYAAAVEDGRPVAAAALNAGIGAGGDFARDTDLERELRIVDLNCRSTVHLAKLLVRDMVARDDGRLLFTSSIASGYPGTFQAVYNASKSFVQSFALALRNELKDTNVTVTSLMPGPTDTDFFKDAGMEDTRIGAAKKDDPAAVAKMGFEALMKGKERVVAASPMSKMMGRTSRFVPDSVKAQMHRVQAEPGKGKHS